jgi:hypothetical protein
MGSLKYPCCRTIFLSLKLTAGEPIFQGSLPAGSV